MDLHQLAPASRLCSGFLLILAFPPCTSALFALMIEAIRPPASCKKIAAGHETRQHLLQDLTQTCNLSPTCSQADDDCTAFPSSIPTWSPNGRRQPAGQAHTTHTSSRPQGQRQAAPETQQLLLAAPGQAVGGVTAPRELRSQQRLLTAAALWDCDLPCAVASLALGLARQALTPPAAKQPRIKLEERCRQPLPAALAEPRFVRRRMLAVFQPAVEGDSSVIQAVTVKSACWSGIRALIANRVLIRSQGPRCWQWVEQSGHTSLKAVHESMMQTAHWRYGLAMSFSA